MSTWAEFAAASPQLAVFGSGRFVDAAVAYLATVRPDGSPRVHPVTPIIGEGRLFLFMEPTSPKGRDLRTNPRYALHSLVVDQHGASGEFLVCGSARPVTDPSTRRAAAAAAPYSPADRYVLFELDVEEASSAVYKGKTPVRQRWRAGPSNSARRSAQS
ncbi:MAG TPA: pyridoxamine 5'-phosphate oxidase family protein [Dehalococcoidia bacterium]|nr:pyridoxamine 5'-phosphate oxidase family protein [Dehalococcoidia bacterium]